MPETSASCDIWVSEGLNAGGTEFDNQPGPVTGKARYNVIAPTILQLSNKRAKTDSPACKGGETKKVGRGWGSDGTRAPFQAGKLKSRMALTFPRPSYPRR